jgi:hypothetical protein
VLRSTLSDDCFVIAFPAENSSTWLGRSSACRVDHEIHWRLPHAKIGPECAQAIESFGRGALSYPLVPQNWNGSLTKSPHPYSLSCH